jgi:GH25 family lysozyme M1 (1,4-beta-N-acetylmuramidase)
MRSGALVLLIYACGPSNIGEDLTLGSQIKNEQGQGLRICRDSEAATNGIDVSYWQSAIDWAEVAADDVEFAIIRVSDGLNHYDTRFQDNWLGAKTNGIARGVYQFFRPTQDPVEQAQMLLEEMGPLQPGDLPPVIDVEKTEDASPEEITEAVAAWIAHVEDALSVRPLIYSGRNFWNSYVRSDLFTAYPFWVANWGVTCPLMPEIWSDWTLWQYSATGAVRGIRGDVDLDTFDGTRATLLATLGHRRSVCGDSICAAEESLVGCPEDCACGVIGAEGGIIDDDDACFVAGGDPLYIRHVADRGYGTGLKWTKSWTSAVPANYGQWQLVFAVPGRYRIDVYIDNAIGGFAYAKYQVQDVGGVALVPVDQRDRSGWVTLGEFDFLAGAYFVRIDDNVADSAHAGQEILLDALAATPIELLTFERPERSKLQPQVRNDAPPAVDNPQAEPDPEAETPAPAPAGSDSGWCSAAPPWLWGIVLFAWRRRRCR